MASRWTSAWRSGAQHVDQVLPEVDDDGHERPHLHQDVEGERRAGIELPSERPRHQHQVGRRRHRQVFGEALDDPEDERLEQGQRLLLLRPVLVVAGTELGGERGQRSGEDRRAQVGGQRDQEAQVVDREQGG